MYIIQQVNRATDQHLIDSTREFNDFDTAIDYLLKTFKIEYGSKAEVETTFWDPFEGDQSTILFSIEIFPPGEDVGLYMFRDWSKLN